MARYTMLFKDYLAEHELPAEFELIEDFSNLFKMHYIDMELGYETPLLFNMKLQEYATLYVPDYVAKISRYEEALAEFDKGGYKRRVIADSTTFNGGATRGTSTDLPIDSTTAEPSSVQATDSYTNTNVVARTEEETGATADEELKRIAWLLNDIKVLKLELLKKFRPLFMRVY